MSQFERQGPLLSSSYLEVSSYYRERLLIHGATSRGVDWNSNEGADLRNMRLLEIVPPEEATYSLIDYGCGYGRCFEILEKDDRLSRYTGFDLVEEMVSVARLRNSGSPRAQFTSDFSQLNSADYVVASGTFNVKLSKSESEWKALVFEQLQTAFSLCNKGFSFNLMSSRVEPSRRYPRLYYADKEELVGFLRENVSRDVHVDDSYSIAEFSVFVSRERR